jgi:hypothetical protein
MPSFKRNPVRPCPNWIGVLAVAAANRVAQHVLNKTPILLGLSVTITRSR